MRRAAIAAALAVLPLPPLAQTGETELPQRRPGQWQIAITTKTETTSFETTVQLCTDAATERVMMQKGLGIARQACQRYDIRRAGDEVHLDTDCRAGSMRTIARAVMSDDFVARYTIRVEARIEIDGRPGEAASSTHQGLWLSETCSGGLEPGDMQMAGGPRVNIRDIPEPGAPQPPAQAPKR